jgi:hypothetical protein
MNATTEELTTAGERFQREVGGPCLFSMEKLKARLLQRGCKEDRNLWRGGQRKRGWLGVKIFETTITVGPKTEPVASLDRVPAVVSEKKT